MTQTRRCSRSQGTPEGTTAEEEERSCFSPSCHKRTRDAVEGWWPPLEVFFLLERFNKAGFIEMNRTNRLICNDFWELHSTKTPPLGSDLSITGKSMVTHILGLTKIVSTGWNGTGRHITLVIRRKRLSTKLWTMKMQGSRPVSFHSMTYYALILLQIRVGTQTHWAHL